MKPSGFTYHRPDTVEAAVAALAEYGDEAKVLAGGQSLVPMLNMRLAAPAHLVDVNRITGLDTVDVHTGQTSQVGPSVSVGATARHRDVEHDPQARVALPLLHRTLAYVAHPTIRNRGTTVGSLAHADPAGEMTAVLALLDGWVSARGTDGERRIPAAELFTGPMTTSVRAGELVTSATFPVPPGRIGTAWVEVARRHGDYAVCGVGVVVGLDDDGRVRSARAAFVSVAPVPMVVDVADAVTAQPVDRADWSAAGRLAAGVLDPQDDIHATGAYRRHLAAVLTTRALGEAAAEAAERLKVPA